MNIKNSIQHFFLGKMQLKLIIVFILVISQIVTPSVLIYYHSMAEDNAITDAMNNIDDESLLSLVMNNHFDFNTRKIFASLYSLYLASDFLLLALLAFEISSAYNGFFTIKDRSFIIDTKDFRLILGHGSFVNNQFLIGELNVLHYLSNDKLTILAACDSNLIITKNNLINIKTFSGTITTKDIFRYLFLNHREFNFNANLLDLYNDENLMSIELDVTAPAAFVTLNPLIIQALLYMQMINQMKYGYNMIQTIEELLTVIAYLTGLGGLQTALANMASLMYLIPIFLENGAINVPGEWGANHINKKIHQNSLPKELDNKKINKFLMPPKIVGMFIARHNPTFYDLHIIVPEVCPAGTDGAGKTIYWEIVIGPSRTNIIVNSIITIKTFGACSNSHLEKSSQTAFDQFLKFYKDGQKEYIIISEPEKQLNPFISEIPLPTNPVAIPDLYPVDENSQFEREEPSTFNEELLDQIMTYLKNILFKMILTVKPFMDAIKWIDNKFIEWGGGVGTIGHIAFWTALLSLIAILIAIGGSVLGLWTINFGRFNIFSGLYLSRTYLLVGLTPLSLDDSISIGDDGSVAQFLYMLEHQDLTTISISNQNEVYYPSVLDDENFDDPILHDSDNDGMPDWWEHKYWVLYGQYQNIHESNKYTWIDANADYDGDGLTNYQEYLWGTNPFEIDSDGDGISDYMEIFPPEDGYMSNPMNPDTDGDGLTDDMEMLWGTNPMNPDTDGDGMTDAWELWTAKVLQWKPAWFCQGPAGCAYFELNPLRYSYDAAVAGMDHDNDGLNNSMESRYFTNPLDPDTDGDGIPDYYEVFPYTEQYDSGDFDKVILRTHIHPATRAFFDIYGYVPRTSPILSDTDGDGFTDYEEFLALSHPLRFEFTPESDIDDDGMPDWWEIKHGLNPYVDDSHLDPDNDGLTNLQEFQMNKDPNRDDVPPTLSNITPSSNVFTYNSNFQISANSYDHNGIDSMVLMIYTLDSIIINEDELNSNPEKSILVSQTYYSSSFTYYLDTRNLDKSKIYYIEIMAFDIAGNYVRHTKIMSFDSTGPSISITSHSNGQIISGTQTVSVNVSDPSGVAKVEFYVNNAKKHTRTSSPYSWSWDTTAYSDGTYTLKIVAFDNYGNQNSISISITIQNSSSSGGGGGGDSGGGSCYDFYCFNP
jgi:hypothetical protein